jgi:hypothetical protein
MLRRVALVRTDVSVRHRFAFICTPWEIDPVHFPVNSPVLWIFFLSTLAKTSNDHAWCLRQTVRTSWCSRYAVYRHPPVSSHQLFHLLHGLFCGNLNRETWSVTICEFRTSSIQFLYLVVGCFTQQTLLIVSRIYMFTNILRIGLFWPQNSTTHCVLRQYNPAERSPF